jgi:hypothetical protein
MLASNQNRDPFNRPAGTGYFSHESRHFVPGYYHAVPPGRNKFSAMGLDEVSAYGRDALLTVGKPSRLAPAAPGAAEVRRDAGRDALPTVGQPSRLAPETPLR